MATGSPNEFGAVKEAEIVGVNTKQCPKKHQVESGKANVGFLHISVSKEYLLLRLLHRTPVRECFHICIPAALLSVLAL